MKRLLNDKWKVRLTAFLAVVILIGPTAIQAQEPDEEPGEQKRIGLIYFPIIFSTPETGFAAGSALGLYYRPRGASADSRPSTITPMFIYTVKKQVMTQLGLDLYLNDGTYHLISALGYLKYPDKFWGIGNDLPESNEEDFTSRRWQLTLDFQRRISPGLNAGVQYEIGGSEVIETEAGGLLDNPGVPGNDGAKVSGAGFVLNWDTRDNIYYPLTGRWFQLSARFYGEGLGSEHSYSRYNLDLRQYLPIRSAHALAIQAYGLFMTGTPPFELMPRLGGASMMRGYYQGRYSDRNMIAVQAEYRRPIRGRLGAVAFIGLGDVASEFGDFRLGDFKHTFGLGLRFLFSPEEKINLRLDWAWGKDTSGMYINLMEAF